MKLRKHTSPTKPVAYQKRSKFNAKRTTTSDGITHPSKKQSLRWVLLLQLERTGQIADLRREVRYPIIVNGQKICTYVADHVYREAVTSDEGTCYYSQVETVEDTKGVLTPIYKLKKKLLKATLGIDIKEV